MASKKIRLWMLAILLAFVATLGCAAERGGNLTVTGIPAGLNGFYVVFIGDELIGGESVNFDTQEITGVRISGGRATLPILWIENENPLRVERFSGNARVDIGLLWVRNERIMILDFVWGADKMFSDITFTNGNATIYWGLGSRLH